MTGREGTLDINEAADRVHAILDGKQQLDVTDVTPNTPMRTLILFTLALLQDDIDEIEVSLPTDPAAAHSLLRAGVLTAATRGAHVLVQRGECVTVTEALGPHSPSEPQLKNVNWHLFGNDSRLRVIADLEDRRRRPPKRSEFNYRRYHWIERLHAHQRLATTAEVLRFLGDADQALFEPVENVHEWAQATKAVAVCSATRGTDRDRLHIVVIDNGLGIPATVRKRAERYRPASGDGAHATGDYASEDGARLVLRLLQEAYGARQVPATEAGQGLHAVGVISGHWAGTLDVLAGDRGHVIEVGRRGQGPLEARGRLELPLSGTAVHVTLEVQRRAVPDTDGDAERPQQLTAVF